MTWCCDADDGGSDIDADDDCFSVFYADMMSIILVLTMMITMALLLMLMMTVFWC